MPPKFTKDEWYIQVNETEGDDIPELPILIVSFKDEDLMETNRFSYKVINTTFGADKFTMVTNSDGTGSLKIAKPLDYEDAQQRHGFNITIQVSDHGGETANSYHIDPSRVFISVIDINDNPPEFDQPLLKASVDENVTIGYVVQKFHARDPDQAGKSMVSYSIDRSSDRKRQFGINQSGVVTVQRPLHRETTNRYDIRILATDDGRPARTATATLLVDVIDISDNTPSFRDFYRPVVMENVDPPIKVIELFADDPDVTPFKKPWFKFQLEPNAPSVIKESFRVVFNRDGDNGKGSATVYTKVKFDREQQKEYNVPIVIADSGIPSLSSTNILTVIIGDENDNIMYPGEKDIFVYSYKSTAKPIKPVKVPIGRVNVEDEDDWDLPDKIFLWRDNKPHPNFELNEDTGELAMVEIVSGGKYTLHFNVMDQKRREEVEANVTVTVKEIPEDAVYSSGSVRISGDSDEDFIRVWDWKNKVQLESKYNKFRDIMAKLLKVKKDNVDIFTVLRKGDYPPVTDVRFSAHGSPYYKASKLDGLIALHRNRIEEIVGVKITMVGIDECLYEEKCEGSCTNYLDVFGDNPVTVNANRTSLVGVRAEIRGECTCGARDLSSMGSCKTRPKPCHNDGMCSDKLGIINCTCLEGFTGPQCQMTTRHFGGYGYAWFEPLQQCESSHFQIDFMTLSPNGLLLYNGPISEADPFEIVVKDFFSLELYNGKPRLLIDFGSGTSAIVIDVKNPLNDGGWHHLDVLWEKENVTMIVDHCQTARNREIGPPVTDRSVCQATTSIKPFNEFLNVNGPLQLGGVKHGILTTYDWKFAYTRKGFFGCIKNVIHNSQMYDLAGTGDSLDSTIGCPSAEQLCYPNELDKFCLHGICVGNYTSAKCVCFPGYEGRRCESKKGIMEIKGMNVSRMNAINWMKNQRTQSFGWGKNTHRAITALYLSKAMTFQGDDLEEELIAKQLELQTSGALLRNLTDPMSVNELSMYVNALLVTCHNVRSIYSEDLLDILADRALSSSSPSPGAYLTLCNANWPLSYWNVHKLLNLLSKDIEYPFATEIHAMTIMALSCIEKKTSFLDNMYNASLINKTVQNFIKNQNPDGSFGNVHTTAVVTQALMSCGQMENMKTNVWNAMKFLMKSLNSSADFLSVYFTLPLFEEKTLVDIGSVNCSGYKRKLEEDEDVMDNLGTKIHVHYSLYIGDKKYVADDMYLKVQENSTVYDVMKVARVANPKYNFSYHESKGHVYIYELAGLANDMEAGNFWLFYIASRNDTVLQQFTQSPDQITMKNKDHLIMWYRSANI